jgi:hypothetical protein
MVQPFTDRGLNKTQPVTMFFPLKEDGSTDETCTSCHLLVFDKTNRVNKALGRGQYYDHGTGKFAQKNANGRHIIFEKKLVNAIAIDGSILGSDWASMKNVTRHVGYNYWMPPLSTKDGPPSEKEWLRMYAEAAKRVEYCTANRQDSTRCRVTTTSSKDKPRKTQVEAVTPKNCTCEFVCLDDGARTPGFFPVHPSVLCSDFAKFKAVELCGPKNTEIAVCTEPKVK